MLDKLSCTPDCKRRRYNKKETAKRFPERAAKIHNNKYDYSKTEYLYSREKVCIVCPEHGEFWQTLNNHLQGQGCPECSRISRMGKRKEKAG